MTSPSPRRRAKRRYQAGDIVHDDRGEALELDEELGRGGQGAVWSLTGGQTAVKLLKPEARVSPAELRIKIASVRRFDLSGIPVARPLSLLVGDDIGYTMELLAQMRAIGSLAAAPYEGIGEWFQATGGLRRRLKLLTLAAEALDRLHARGLAYGDVSPGNILVSERSEHDRVWLIDPDNLSVQARSSGSAYATPGYGAPEVFAGSAGQDTLTDAFSFAVLAFEVLTLKHPFVGDMVDRDATKEEDAFAGRLPWIDHSSDERNRSSQALSRDIVLTTGLRRLAALTFEEGLHQPGRRPSLREWCDKLDQAALLTVGCIRCAGTYHAAASRCPWCGQERPPILRCDIHGHVPDGTVPGIWGAETDRLQSMVLAAMQPQVVRARNALLCLDPGPSAIPVDPGEPVAELAWDGGDRLTVQRTGRHYVSLADRGSRREAPLGVGEVWSAEVARAGGWSIHFGTEDRVHRFMKILVPRMSAS